jgi:hypothetical protein
MIIMIQSTYQTIRIVKSEKYLFPIRLQTILTKVNISNKIFTKIFKYKAPLNNQRRHLMIKSKI